MSKIEVKSVPDAASKPSHPEHRRWTFETLVKEDLEWRRTLPGGADVTQRSAEERVGARLTRLWARKRDQSTAIPLKPRDVREPLKHDPAADMAREHGLQLFRDGAIPKLKEQETLESEAPCECGQCRKCRLKIRIRAFLEASPTGELQHKYWADELGKLLLHARCGTGPFRRIYGKERRRKLQKELELLADRSTGKFGFWA